MTKKTTQIQLGSPEETTSLAAAFAKHLTKADVLLLIGDIGAGKTHFARSLIQAKLGYAEDVPSPTFTLVQTYEAEDIEIWHTDLYRLTHPDEVVELGLTEAFETEICLVEWPDRLADLTPSSALTLDLKLTETAEERLLTLTWSDPKWDDRLKDILND